jgi:hypothetical protein
MRKRAAILLVAAVAAASFAVSASAVAGASVSAKSAPVCAGKTKKVAFKDIKTAYDYFLNGSKGYTPDQQAAYIQYLSGPKLNADALAKFQASAVANAAAAKTTGVVVKKITCKGNKAAVVNFDLVLGGKPSGIVTFPGGAVLEGKTWKVSGATLCNTQGLGDSSLLESEPCATILVKEPV